MSVRFRVGVLLIVSLWMNGILASGCSASKEEGRISVLVGRIAAVGNEPFVRLAVEVDNRTVVFLDCGERLQAYLLANQGKNVSVEYTDSKDTPEGRVVTVLKATLLHAN